MKLVFGGESGGTVRSALATLIGQADSLCLAVSYIRMSGWNIFLDLTEAIDPDKIRIVCTNQLGVTDPRAVRDAIKKGIGIRLYNGSNIFHSKLYLGRKADAPAQFLIGSANLSDSALNTGVEAAVAGEDPGGCSAWFEELFDKRSVDFNDQILVAMDKAFVARIVSKIVALPAVPAVQRGLASEDIIESVFATLDDIALLNLDQAGNNVRNLDFALQVLRDGPTAGKQQSEMNLLGFADGGALNTLGKQSAASKDTKELANFWIAWLKTADDETLLKIGRTGRLLRAKLAFANFWRLDHRVIEYFLAHASQPSDADKKVCQVIELLANAGPIARTLSLEQVRDMTIVLDDVSKIPIEAAERIKNYLENKGARNWDVPDRPLLVKTWLALD